MTAQAPENVQCKLATHKCQPQHTLTSSRSPGSVTWKHQQHGPVLAGDARGSACGRLGWPPRGAGGCARGAFRKNDASVKRACQTSR